MPQRPGIRSTSRAMAMMQVEVPMTFTTSPSTNLVKQLYPGAYDNLTDAEIGRAMKRKYPEQFSDCADLPVTAVEDARQRIRGALGFRGIVLAQRYATYGGRALPNALRDPKLREEPQEIPLEGLLRMDPEFARLSTQAQIAVLDDEKYQPASRGPVTVGTER
jgi:hypothetical protein